MKIESAGNLLDTLAEECTENIIDEVKIAGMALFESGNLCKIFVYNLCCHNWNSLYNQHWN